MTRYIEQDACLRFREEARKMSLNCFHSVGMTGCTYDVYHVTRTPHGVSTHQVASVFVPGHSLKTLKENVELIWQGYIEQQIAGDA